MSSSSTFLLSTLGNSVLIGLSVSLGDRSFFKSIDVLRSLFRISKSKFQILRCLFISPDVFLVRIHDFSTLDMFSLTFF